MEAVEILIQRADGSSERRSLVDGVYEIGRESGDILLGDPNVSNTHALLHVRGGQVSVTDNRSTNGTFDSAGQRLSGPYVISATQGVRLGNTSIRVAAKAAAGRGGTQLISAVPDAIPSVTAPTGAPAVVPTIKRQATVLKAPDHAPGILFVDGQQKSFQLESVWRVAEAPRPGMSVEVELDVSGKPTAITAADPAALIREHGQKAMHLAQSGLGVAVERMGKVPFITALVLLLGWFIVPSVSFGQVLSYTFWDLTNANLQAPFELLQGKVSVGMFGILGLAAVFIPFAQLHKPHLRVLNAAPVAFLGVWFTRQLIGIGGSVNEAKRQQEQVSRTLNGFMGGGARTAVKPGDDESLFDSLGGMFGQLLWEQVSFGLGLWVVCIASIVLSAQVFTRAKLER